MVVYQLTGGGSIVLDAATSRAAGYHDALDAETAPADAGKILAEIHEDAEALAGALGKTLTIVATHPDCEPWEVDQVGPPVAPS